MPTIASAWPCCTCLQQQRESLKDKFGELRQKGEELELLVADAEPRTRCAELHPGLVYVCRCLPFADSRGIQVAFLTAWPGCTRAWSEVRAGCCRHQLSLYAHISRITWHFDKEDMVAGTVSNPETGDIRKFELEPQEMGDFAVVNALWDMMDGRQ